MRLLKINFQQPLIYGDGDRKKRFRMNKLSQQSSFMGFVETPEVVHWYVEWLSLFIAKRLKTEKNRMK